tara:strand:+ start:41 stop:307 length:267 start_codon:yes stop_codon:yes gene_type:complete
MKKTQIIKKILFLKLIRFFNTEIFFFILTLSLTLFFGYLVDNPPIFQLVGHYLIWIFISDKFINKNEMKEENSEITLMIKSLSEEIKK